MKSFLSIAFCLLAITLTAWAQKVEDVTFAQRGTKVEISYTLADKKATVVVECAVKGGVFKPLSKVTGDVGRDIAPGRRTIVWDALAEYGEFRSTEVQFRVKASSLIEGCLPGLFSVSATTKVKFSMGNLQYTTTGTHAVAGGGTAKGTWRFAAHQWDYVGSPASAGSDYNLSPNGTVSGSDNKNISSSYSGWIDLFGWGTSGWNSGADCYSPYSTSRDYEDYYPGGSFSNNLTGSYAKADWGVYNAISNGGNAAGQWRTLTQSEWYYLFYTRANASSKYGQATVNGVQCVVLLPDSWTLPSGLSFTSGASGGYTDNTYTAAQWALMEAAGAVLLPAAGYRNGSSVYFAGQLGYYWSSTANDSYDAYVLCFYIGDLDAGGYGSRRYGGQAVRLVR